MAANAVDYIPLNLTEGCPCDDCSFYTRCSSDSMACKVYKVWVNTPRPTQSDKIAFEELKKKIRTPTKQIFLNLNKEGQLGSRRSKK